VRFGGDLDDAHAGAASFGEAGHDVDLEQTLEQPGPWVSRRRWRLGRRLGARLEERHLRWRTAWLGAGHDLAHGGVGGEHAVVAEHVEARGVPGRRTEELEVTGDAA
jgi:hypothetical protein